MTRSFSEEIRQTYLTTLSIYTEFYLQLIVRGLQSLVSVVEISVLPVYNISQGVIVLLQGVFLPVQPAEKVKLDKVLLSKIYLWIRTSCDFNFSDRSFRFCW